MKGSMDDILAALGERRRLVLTAHERPDGDALGSALGLRRILAGAGVEARIAGCRPIPPQYEPFLREDVLEEEAAGALGWAEALVALDVSDLERTGPVGAEARRSGLPVLVIDHHVSNPGFGAACWVDETASSVGEMIWLLAGRAGWGVPPAAAEALWLAVVTDTGRFQYENTTPRTLRVAAELVARGVDVAACGRRIYGSVPLAEWRLRERALRTLALHAEGRFASVELRRADFDALGCGPELAQDIVSIPRSVSGVEAGFFFYDLPAEAAVKVSVRAAPPHDAEALCRLYGGGGHARAAGCSVEGPLEEVKRTVLARAEALWTDEG
jgi:phosphoesterase RecJ-like protein